MEIFEESSRNSWSWTSFFFFNEMPSKIFFYLVDIPLAMDVGKTIQHEKRTMKKEVKN